VQLLFGFRIAGFRIALDRLGFRSPTRRSETAAAAAPPEKPEEKPEATPEEMAEQKPEEQDAPPTGREVRLSLRNASLRNGLPEGPDGPNECWQHAKVRIEWPAGSPRYRAKGPDLVLLKEELSELSPCEAALPGAEGSGAIRQGAIWMSLRLSAAQVQTGLDTLRYPPVIVPPEASRRAPRGKKRAAPDQRGNKPP
jgi:hypothetical protein